MFLTGIKLDQTVEGSVRESGIDDDCYLYKLYPKMCDILIRSKSDNTVKSYFNSFKRWEKFIKSQGHNSLPAQPVHVALYLTHLINNDSTFHPIQNAVYGIKWAHEVNGLNDPTINSYVTSILDASKRIAPKKKQKKDPITTDVLIELCDYYKNSSDLLIIRDLTMMLLSFAGFLRFDELNSLRFSDIKVHETHIVLNIYKSKTDQYRQGSEVLIAKGFTSACPISMYNRYIKLAGFGNDSTKYVFRAVFRSGNTCKLIYKDKKLSYTAARESILKKLRSVCPEYNLGLHSFRAGGATKAANMNVSDRCLKRHGRWKTDFSKDGYIVDDLEKRLKVSQALCL